MPNKTDDANLQRNYYKEEQSIQFMLNEQVLVGGYKYPINYHGLSCTYLVGIVEIQKI